MRLYTLKDKKIEIQKSGKTAAYAMPVYMPQWSHKTSRIELSFF